MSAVKRVALCVFAGPAVSGCSCNGTLKRECTLDKFGGTVNSQNQCKVCSRYRPVPTKVRTRSGATAGSTPHSPVNTSGGSSRDPAADPAGVVPAVAAPVESVAPAAAVV